ncbi:MAG: tRNA (N6-isopentenyl adenosine(37)-C2)-methylthiotransferase MiaB [Bacteroidota bacterium]
MLGRKRVYIETYGCQMNVADSEVVSSILHSNGFALTLDIAEADIVFLNTCSVRDNAETKVYNRLKHLRHHKKKRPEVLIGLLGCMAERLRAALFDSNSLLDLVVGPDEYRKLPSLIDGAYRGEKGLAVRLSRVENYDDITPLRTDGVSAWLSVMRGCDKFCSFCVVPFTRGRERSRTLDSIICEVRGLSARGFREVTLLGQNVNSYRDGETDFADLLARVAEVDRSMRVRFLTSHPQDMSDRLIETIARHTNICNYIHLPLQSGSDRILGLMNRDYTADHYFRLVKRIREAIPGVGLSTDIIAGFPSETDEDHQKTLAVMEQVRFDGAYMFRYSPREGTRAWTLKDDVPEEIKIDRLNAIITRQQKTSYESNQRFIGTIEEVLVEGESKKSPDKLQGRTDTNRVVIFPRGDAQIGEMIRIEIRRANSATLFGDQIIAEPVIDTADQTISDCVR